MRTRLLLALILAGVAPAVSRGLEGQRLSKLTLPGDGSMARAVSAARISGTPPSIDGRLDEPIWKTAVVASDFVQTRPRPGDPPSYQTEIRILYDADAIYIGARMLDPHPDSIVAQLTRRDNVGVSDWIQLAFDSYHDRRTAYVFGLNPRGVKQDAFVFDDTRSDDNWDAVWQGAAQIDSLGWTAEFRIPLSQLRFNVGTARDGGKQTWGVDFKRTVGRSREESFWAPPPKDESKLVSVFGELDGLVGLSTPRRVELMPYTVAKTSRRIPEAGNPFEKRGSYDANVGADLKYGVGSNLTLTATFNPDFGQVEADPSVVNLSAFESFFPEKRPFFLEGADIFRFSVGLGDGDLGNESLFYSRRIGRSPQLGTPDEASYSDVPQSVPILGAAKLSGKTSGGWSVGVLDAVTGRAQAAYVTDAGLRGAAPVEPLTNYAVARLIRTGHGGQSALGAVFTATDRQLNAAAFRDNLVSAAYTGGLDFRHRFGRGRYEVTGYLLGSALFGSDSAIAQRQRDPTHYFQRPGSAHLTYDPARASMGGWAGSTTISKISGAWTWGVIENAKSPGFDVNDLGFSRNSDQWISVVYTGWNTLKPVGRFQHIGLNGDVYYATSWGGESVARGIEGNVNYTLLSQWNGGMYVGHDFPALSAYELRGGPALLVPGSTRFNLWAATDSRKRIGSSLGLFYMRVEDGAGQQLNVGPQLWLRPSTRLELSLQPSASWARTSTQYVTDEEADGRTHYVFAALRQTTVSISTRLNYTFSPTLSFQLYAQPFASTGSYSRFQEVANPRAARLADRFRSYTPAEIQWDAAAEQYRVGGVSGFGFDNPDFGYRDMRSNAVLRWEYRPGSTLFLVWSQERPSSDSYGVFRAGPELRSLLDAPARNVFLVKASYWLGK